MVARKKGRKPAKGGARKVIERKPSFQGWRTTDEEEVERRAVEAGTPTRAVELDQVDEAIVQDHRCILELPVVVDLDAL